MPIYEYQCSACGARLEKMQKMSDPVLVDCPDCGKPSLEKLVSAAGFTLKGTGWYKTDYANKPSQSASKSEGGGGSCAKPECKTDIKPSGSEKS